ncbi:MAG TPA: tetratricopeptide repeat protein [Candidatus Polarisedimenticolia bacterium]|nr:tetratricopeptide repeat protein [Candidatus Polarisedimenticolia bacterium]
MKRRVLLAAMVLACMATGPVLAQEDPRALVEAARWKKARALLEPKVKANPSDAEAAALLSQVRLAYGDGDGAISLAETALKLDGNNAAYHWQLAKACGEQARKAGMFKGLSLVKRFRSEADATLALDPKHIEARMYLISFYAGAPGIAGGDKKKAEQVAQDVAKIDPAWGHLAHARLVEETAEPKDNQAVAEREASYKKGLEAAKTPEARYAALSGLVNLYLSPALENFDRAAVIARDMAAIDPPRVEPHLVLAIAYASGGKLAELDTALAESEKVVPDSLGAYYQAGRVLFVRGTDYARAEKYFRKFLTQEPGPGPSLAHAHWRLGMVLDKLDRKKEAIAEMEQALRLKPDLEEAKKELKRLKG